MRKAVAAILAVALLSLVLPQTASAGSTNWTTPAPCSGNAVQNLSHVNPNITNSAAQVEGLCTHGQIISYVSFFGTNYTYNTGKKPTYGSLLILFAPTSGTGAYGNPNGMWVDRWVNSAKASTFVSP